MSIEPGYSGQAFMPEALGRIAELAALVDVPIQVDGGVGEENAARRPRGRGVAARRRERRLRRARSRPPPTAGSAPRRAERRALDRALELAERARAGAPTRTRRSAPSSSGDGELVGEGVTERDGGRHAEIVALDAAGERARGATLYVTLEPCAHHGRTPPCVDAIVAAGVARVVAGCARPEPPRRRAALGRLRAAGVEVELDDRSSARVARTRRGGPGRRSGARSSRSSSR